MLTRRGCGALVLVLGGGCFADPPAGGPQDTGSTSGGGTTSVVASSTTASSTTAEPGTTSTGGDGSSSSSSSSSGAAPTSTGHEDDTTGAGPMCPPGEVQVGMRCVAPLVVSEAFTVAEPLDPVPSNGAPCIQAECPNGRPLGGGFVLDGLLAHATHQEADVYWTTCAGSDPDDDSDLWQGFARCSEAEGDVFVVSEGYDLDGDEGTTCYDVACPEGSTLVGGGGRWGSSFVFQGSEPNDDGSRWQVCGLGGMEPTEVEVDAYCAVLPPGAETVVLTESVELDGGGVSDCVEVSCSTGVAVSGGGFGVVTSVIEASHPLPNEADGWRVCARADSFFTLTVRARVLCVQG